MDLVIRDDPSKNDGVLTLLGEPKTLRSGILAKAEHDGKIAASIYFGSESEGFFLVEGSERLYRVGALFDELDRAFALFSEESAAKRAIDALELEQDGEVRLYRVAVTPNHIAFNEFARAPLSAEFDSNTPYTSSGGV